MISKRDEHEHCPLLNEHPYLHCKHIAEDDGEHMSQPGIAVEGHLIPHCLFVRMNVSLHLKHLFGGDV